MSAWRPTAPLIRFQAACVHASRRWYAQLIRHRRDSALAIGEKDADAANAPPRRGPAADPRGRPGRAASGSSSAAS